jgi:hypothetical protein
VTGADIYISFSTCNCSLLNLVLQVLQLLDLLLVMLLVELVIIALLVRFMPCLFFFGAWRCCNIVVLHSLLM